MDLRMHRTTVFHTLLLLGETNSGWDLRIDCQGYAECQQSQQYQLHIRAFHIFTSPSVKRGLKRIEVSNPLFEFRKGCSASISRVTKRYCMGAAVTVPTAAEVTTLLPTLRLPLVSFPDVTSKLSVAVASIVRDDISSFVLS